jgi:hypothetical protein
LATHRTKHDCQDRSIGHLVPAWAAVPSGRSGHAQNKGRDAIRLQPAGAQAANMLGLCDQVPMKLVYLTDGPSRNGYGRSVMRSVFPPNLAGIKCINAQYNGLFYLTFTDLLA